MARTKSLEVRLWGEVVGYLAEDPPGVIRFEYDESFRQKKLEIAPIEMPLATTNIYEPRNISSTFRGLPGIIADCLPDRFGMRAIETFFTKHYQRKRDDIGVLDKLLYVGDRAIGALEFAPAIETNLNSDDYLNLQDLVTAAKQLVEGKAEKVPLEILRMSASPGGRVAKALVDYSPSNNQLRSGFAEPKAGFIPCLLKFDGVSDGDPANEYGRLEYVYSKLASLCNIDMPNTYLIEGETPQGPGAHFLVERFDRNERKEKLYHYASLCGLYVRDFIEKHSCTYEEYLRLVQSLCKNQQEVEEAFRRMLFNLMFRNQDDHTKNLGFCMDESGTWRLAPAFDLNYVNSLSGVAATHQMTLNGKDCDFEFTDLLQAGKYVGIPRSKVKRFIEQFSNAANQFMRLAEESGLKESHAKGIRSRFLEFNL